MASDSSVEVSLLSPVELAAELGLRVRRERLRQNLSQRTLAARAGVSRVTVTRMEGDGSATLTSFLAVLSALRRTDVLAELLEPPPAMTIDEFVAGTEPTRRRGRR